MFAQILITALIFLVLYALVKTSEQPLDSHLMQRVQVNEKKNK